MLYRQISYQKAVSIYISVLFFRVVTRLPGSEGLTTLVADNLIRNDMFNSIVVDNGSHPLNIATSHNCCAAYIHAHIIYYFSVKKVIVFISVFCIQTINE